MSKEVLITLRGTQVNGEEEPETVELMTWGILTGRNGKFAVSYEETELTGTPGVTTTFLIFNPKRIVLTRDGAIRSRMVFETNVKHEALYDLGFGSLLVGINAKEISADLSEDGGSIFIDYTVEIEQQISSRNTYWLEITPVSTG